MREGLAGHGHTVPPMGIPVRALTPDIRRFDELPDEDLTAAARTGDDAAFEALFRRHQPAVLAFCRHMLGRADEAQDAAQHTFLTAYRVLRDGGRLENVRPWLFTVARNRCVSMLRARRDHDPGDAAEEPATDGLAAEVQQRADLRALLRDVAELPEDQRAALLLAEVGDLTHAEIAEVIGVRVRKVKALVFQAREALLAAKDARETPCAAVREELATARGATLRRAHLRRHLHVCAGCREFRDDMRGQRRALGLLLPVVPPALRDVPWLGAAETTAGAGAAAAGAKAVVAKFAVGALLAGGVAAGGTAAVVAPPSPDWPPRAAKDGPARGEIEARGRAGASTLALPRDAGDRRGGTGVARYGSIPPMERHTWGTRSDRGARNGAKDRSASRDAAGRGSKDPATSPGAGDDGTKNRADDDGTERGHEDRGTNHGARDDGANGRGGHDHWSKDRGDRDDWSKDRTDRDHGSKDRGTRDHGSKDRGTRDRESKDRGARDRGSKDHGARDPGSKGNGVRNRGSNDSAARDRGSKDRGARDHGSKARDTNPQPARNDGATSRPADPGAKERGSATPDPRKSKAPREDDRNQAAAPAPEEPAGEQPAEAPEGVKEPAAPAEAEAPQADEKPSKAPN
jgi:RNA polymerase sigma factor (sigma-70 family)